MAETGRKKIIFIMLIAALLPALGYCLVDSIVVMQLKSITLLQAMITEVSGWDWLRRFLVSSGCFIIGPVVIKQDTSLNRLLREQKYLKNLVRNMQCIFPEPMLMISRSMTEIKMTTHQAVQLGFSPENPPGSLDDIMEKVHLDDSLFLRTAINRALNEGRAGSVEFRCKTANGERIVNWRIGAINEFGVIPVVMSLVPDDTLFRRLMKDKEQLLEKVEDLNLCIIWKYDFASETFTYFGPVDRVMKLPEGVVPGHRIDLFQKLSSSDRQQPEILWHKALDSEDSVSADYRVKSGDDEYWVRERIGVDRYSDNSNPETAFGVVFDVTAEYNELKERDKVIQEYRSIFDGAPNGIFMFAANSMEILYVNLTACNMFGYARQDLLRQSRSALHEDAELERLKDTFALGSSFESCSVGRVECLKRNGDLFQADLDLNKIKSSRGDYIIASYQLPHEDPEAGQERKMLEEAVGLSDFNLLICRPEDFSFEFFSDAACRDLDYSPEEMESLTLPEVDSNLTLDICKNLWKELKTKRSITFESLSRSKSGKSFPIEISAFYLNSDDKEYFCCVIRNISERKQSEEAVLAAKEQAEAASSVKAGFVASISHQIRTPLNGIMGFAELMRMPGETTAKMQEYADIILQCGHNLQELIENLMDISRIEAGEVELNSKEFSVNRLIDDLYDAFFSMVNNSGKDVVLNTHKELPDNESVISSDDQRIRQILRKLIDNSCKYTDHGSVEFGYKIKAPWLEFYVRDTGVGMDKKKVESIFEPFKDDEEKFKQRGASGLGLAIARKLINLMGGDIRCESTPDSGTCFYFTLPFKSRTSGTHNKVVEAKAQAQNDGYDWSSKKILVVEDDPVNYLFIEKILEPTKVNLVHTEMAMPGIAVCREDPAIDLVLMDIRLPDLSGWDATREIKKFRPNLPVIAQTANAMLEDKQKSFAAGCDDYLTKPLPKDALLEAVDRFLFK